MGQRQAALFGRRIETCRLLEYHHKTGRGGLDKALTKLTDADLLTDVAGVVMADGTGRFLLQRRDNDPGVSSADKLAMFGGHKELGETGQTCALREVEEETGRSLTPAEIEHIITLRTRFANGDVRRGSFFFADNIDPSTFVVTEGRLEIIAFEDLPKYFFQMVPSTAYVLAHLSAEIMQGTRSMSGITI